MVSWIKNISILSGVTLSVVIYTSVALLFHGGGLSDRATVLVSIASFLFGIFVSFSISNNQNKLHTINELLKADAAMLTFIYRACNGFSNQKQNEIRKYIDKYLVAQIDYVLKDFNMSDPEFQEIVNFAIALDPETKKEVVLYDGILSRISESAINRRQIETLTRQEMSMYEWISILSLLVLIVVSVFSLNDGSILFTAAAILMPTAATTLVFVLRDLDRLKWKEQAWIWEPLHHLFLSLDLLPYYSDDILENRRTVLKPGQRIRIARYPDPYPDMSNKKVNIITT
jgi:hypothetical protein